MDRLSKITNAWLQYIVCSYEQFFKAGSVAVMLAKGNSIYSLQLYMLHVIKLTKSLLQHI